MFLLISGITTYETEKSRPNVKFSLYLKKAGLASRNIVHLQKIILRCVDFCFYFHH